MPSSTFPTPPLRIDQCSEVLEPVRRNQPCGNQLPQRIFRFTRQPFGCAREIGEEQRAFPLERCQHVASRMGQRFEIFL